MEEPTAPDYRQKVREVEEIEKRIRDLHRRREGLGSLASPLRWRERREIDKRLESLEHSLYAARARVSEEKAWRSDNTCPPDRSRGEHEQFRAEQQRIEDETGNHNVWSATTWPELKKWENWSRDQDARHEKQAQAHEEGGWDARRREVERQKFDYGLNQPGDSRRDKRDREDRDERERG